MGDVLVSIRRNNGNFSKDANSFFTVMPCTALLYFQRYSRSHYYFGISGLLVFDDHPGLVSCAGPSTRNMGFNACR